MAFIQEVIIAGAAGLCSHLFYFVRGEHHLEAPKILRFHIGFGLILYFVQLLVFQECHSRAITNSLVVMCAYLAGLFSSIVVYRVFFHRLWSFPGPFLARVTKLYHASQIRRADNYLFLERLHHQYGDFVRTGPNEITIFTPQAVNVIHGPSSECTKAAWYDNILPIRSVVTTRARAAHDVRRRIWDQGFSIKALKQHEDKILTHAQLLDAIIFRNLGIGINVTALFEYYGFDVMGDVGYSRTFNMLENQHGHYAIDLFKKGTMILGTMTPIPWLIHTIFSLPFITRGWDTYLSWADRELQRRIKIDPGRQDTIGWFLDAASIEHGIKEDYQWLMGDFITLLTGGSEPVVSTIVYLFYHLAASPAEVIKLREEMVNLALPPDAATLHDLQHLNALISETLRLHPPIPSGGLRNTPDTGIKVGETYIPGNATVLTPHYSLGRREDCFVQANAFIPERWYSRPDLIKDRTAFMPFGVGRYSCVGRNLGLMEIRTLTALLVQKYDIGFADGDDGTQLHEGTNDCFATSPGKLQLIFRLRV